MTTMNTSLARSINEVLGAELRWQEDEDTADGIVARVYSHEDMIRYRRDLREDETIIVSSSKDEEGREWLFVAPRV